MVDAPKTVSAPPPVSPQSITSTISVDRVDIHLSPYERFCGM